MHRQKEYGKILLILKIDCLKKILMYLSFNSYQTGTKANTIFSWKSIMKNHSYLLLSSFIMVSVVILGFFIRNLERANLNANGELTYVWDAFWFVIVSMFTSKFAFNAFSPA
jgi:hypothetical protein